MAGNRITTVRVLDPYVCNCTGAITKGAELCSLRPSRYAAGSYKPCGLAGVARLLRIRGGPRLAALLARAVPILP